MLWKLHTRVSLPFCSWYRLVFKCMVRAILIRIIFFQLNIQCTYAIINAATAYCIITLAADVTSWLLSDAMISVRALCECEHLLLCGYFHHTWHPNRWMIVSIIAFSYGPRSLCFFPVTRIATACRPNDVDRMRALGWMRLSREDEQTEKHITKMLIDNNGKRHYNDGLESLEKDAGLASRGPIRTHPLSRQHRHGRELVM